jgi:hypothetical protein
VEIHDAIRQRKYSVAAARPEVQICSRLSSQRANESEANQ